MFGAEVLCTQARVYLVSAAQPSKNVQFSVGQQVFSVATLKHFAYEIKRLRFFAGLAEVEPAGWRRVASLLQANVVFVAQLEQEIVTALAASWHGVLFDRVLDLVVFFVFC